MSEKPRPERDQTDESLRTERQNTDAAIAERLTEVEEDADELVEKARKNADEVLGTARDMADEKLDTAGPAAAVVKARAREDEVLQKERDSADETLRRERDEQARTLAALLPLEREKTDRYLLTERVRSDDKLANRDDFLGMVSHDLRNLLSGIVLNAETLGADAPASEEGDRIRAKTDRIQRYVARMNRLIGDLVDVVSIDAGKLAVDATPGDATVLMGEAVDAFSGVAAAKGLRLEAAPSGGPLLAQFDHDRILQVLANLITNAMKFTPRGGVITLSGERAGDELRLCVRDTGCGIPAQMLEAVFERFWQMNKTDQRGLGLGLYISRCIVLAHGGKIWVQSAVGDGSTFQFTFPVARPG